MIAEKGNICDFSTNNCDPGSNFNFFKMYYCYFWKWFGEFGMQLAIWPVGLTFLFLLMYILSSTADEYLSPSLEYITERFKISESFAGVTFLAFGNGAPDVFSSISSAKSSAISDSSNKD